ncbi:hypothetical protein FSP39_007457 [Pinctada imbricata]|uniref:G-protein coupled receptors family 1 profile domain-containing protein n=1 Tax=Pinctada imbricata TaxID=66713 RepID=A0AA88Y2N2_PINIB|nr:hypothetical protein FSP39_007457 [Pinctada imbricata]
MNETTSLNNFSLSTSTPNTTEMQIDPSNVYQIFCPEATMVDKYVTPYIYVIGFPGNIFSLIIWLQRRMRNSSGYYLAALALTDLIFLSLQVIYELNEKWNIKCLDEPFICEFYPIIFMTSQYLSPLFVLAFTVERYISICHPFKRETYCTTKRAMYVIICLSTGSLLINCIQGYFWKYYDNLGKCYLRDEVIENGTQSFWTIWTWCVEALLFFIVPLAILLFNILVIIEAKKLSRYEQTRLQSRSQRNSATTVMLLAVSFYQIFTTLPVTVVVTLYYSFPPGEFDVLQTTGVADATWKRHFDYIVVKTIIEEIGLTHYACNFYIYLITGKVFRQEFKKLMRPLIGGLKVKFASNNSVTEYTTVKGGNSVNGKRDTTVRMSNGHALPQNGDASELEPVLKSDETPL